MVSKSRDNRLFYWLNVAQRRVLNAVDQSAEERIGITTTQLGLLFAIGRRDGVPLKDVCQALALGAPAVTGLSHRMEKLGLVKRQPDPVDRRAVRLVLTEKGRSTREKSQQLLEDMNLALTQDLSEEDLAATLRVLKTLSKNFTSEALQNPSEES